MYLLDTALHGSRSMALADRPVHRKLPWQRRQLPELSSNAGGGLQPSPEWLSPWQAAHPLLRPLQQHGGGGGDGGGGRPCPWPVEAEVSAVWRRMRSRQAERQGCPR